MDKFYPSQVAQINGMQLIKKRYGKLFYVCPFCGNTREKFAINDSKNWYHCYSCGAGGTAISLHMNLNPKGEYSDASEGMKRAAKDIWALINGDTTISHDFKAYEPKDETVLKKTDAEISAVYKTMLSFLPLYDIHKEKLLKRGMDEEMIRKLKFKSIQKKHSKPICKRLLEMGFDLEGIPGFYQDKYDRWNLRIPEEGTLCPVYDGDYNFIIGFQIRSDKSDEELKKLKLGKYTWISSGNLWEGCKKGCGSGAIASCLPGKNEDVVIIVEGILKAAVTWCLLNSQITVVGFPGTSSINSLIPFIERYKGRLFFVAFDMDRKISVKNAGLLTRNDLNKEEAHYIETTKGIEGCTNKACQFLDSHGAAYHLLQWDYEGDYWKGTYKGIDDFLLGYKERNKFVSYLAKKGEENTRIQKIFA